MPLYTKRKLKEKSIYSVFKSEAKNLYQMKSILEAISSGQRFDIFLSYRSLDFEEALVIFKDLEAVGCSVYVDWKDDLDRGNVTRDTADHLRNMLRRSKSLLYASTVNAGTSQWMPWELGFADALHGKVAVVPVLEEDIQENSFTGSEYLGLYPYLSRSAIFELFPALYIHLDEDERLNLNDWLKDVP